MKRYIEAVTGLVLGAVAGTVVGFGLMAFRAHVQSVYLHSATEVVGWPLVPVVVLAGLGLVLGWRDRARLWRWAAGSMIDFPIGLVSGALLGLVVAPGGVGPWAGGIFGAAIGVLLGPLLGNRIRASHRVLENASHTVAVLAGLVVVVGVVGAWRGAAQVPPTPPLSDDPAPDPSRVSAAVFLLGDAGALAPGATPLIPALRADMERWSRAAAGGDGETVLLVLGDVIYPDGMRDRDHPGFPEDSMTVEAQLAALPEPPPPLRPDSLADVRALVLPGNHDWGTKEDQAGARRLRNLADFLRSRSRFAAPARLAPPAGQGGPEVVDVGKGLRLILLDTAWWLLDARPEAKERVIEEVRDALAGADGRRTIIAAHHPLRSAGPHGGLADFERTLGIRAVLAQSGVLLQDIFSPAYRELREGLAEVFLEVGGPDVFAGGHEHSLQALSLDEPGHPRLSLVVGSGSKLTGVRPIQGMQYAASQPGWGRILLLRDGTLHVTLYAAPERFLSCAPEGWTADPSDPDAGRPEGSGAEADAEAGTGDSRGAIGACMAEGVEAFRPVWTHEISPHTGS